MWVLTVFTETASSLAISGLERPSADSAAPLSSPGLSPSACGDEGLNAPQ
jgi:hypothetical protein